jgi:alkaline phosphatase D
MKNLFFLLTVTSVVLAIKAVALAASSSSCSSHDVLWVWKGALTSNSVRFKFGLKSESTCKGQDFILRAYPELKPNEKAHSALVHCEEGLYVSIKQCILTNLPHTGRKYEYELVLLAQPGSEKEQLIKKGILETPEEDGTPYHFRFLFSSCADELSDPKVFQEMAKEKALFFLHMGDLHYANLEINDLSAFRNAYKSILTSLSGKAMLDELDLPFAYMWDDHDYGPDNSDKTAPGRPAALQTYREFVPHYPLTTNSQENGPIHQTFTIGRVRFILTDLRSERTPNLAPDVPSKTVLGAKQKKWFKGELERATQDENIGLIVWCSTMPWNDDQRKWGYFTNEQRELVNYMKAHKLNTWTPIVIVSGDAHMIALDDGSNTPGNLTTFHAAALGRPGSIKGGPYSHGAFPGSGQYGVMDVVDNGKKICLRFKGKSILKGTLIEYDTCAPEKYPGTPYIPPPKTMRTLGRLWRKTKKLFFQRHVMALFVGIALFLTSMKLYRLWSWKCQSKKKNGEKKD